MNKVLEFTKTADRTRSRVKDETGNRYGKLQVLRYTGRDVRTKYGGAMWLCQCDCGNKKIMRGGTLRRGKGRQSCGNCVKGAGRLANVLVLGEMAPCDRDCEMWQRCKDERLACRPFKKWVGRGGRVLPDVSRFPPNFSIYQGLFLNDE